ncbi:uncharacterized protein LOC108740672 [Agrilus planipennis]|uniref:Uncharacterized protein LOC108740672 n=1 Tax=Agrilus planipennis TaxID=224129 RepID=A0A1W4XE07_AGRPL|nr:uncharacterized protein LOC108740672 [Agrilus planipennis]
MDEAIVHIHQQSSISSDSNAEEISRIESHRPSNKQICLTGSVGEDADVCELAKSFGHPVVISENGFEYLGDKSHTTIFILDSFEGDLFNELYKHRQQILGVPALKQLANKNEKLPDNTRPLYNLAMSGVIVCFTGFRNKEDLTKIVPLVHHMGGSIRKEMSTKVTHLIAKASGGDKYKYAITFRVPVINEFWVLNSWDRKDDLEFSATMDAFVAEHKLKPFCGTKVCFVGFPEEEEKHMVEVLEANGGCATTLEDPHCSHVVMDHREAYILEPLESPLNTKSTPVRNSNPFISFTSALSSSPSQINNLNDSSFKYKDVNTVDELFGECSNSKTPNRKIISIKSTPYLETVLEKSHDNCVSSRNAINDNLNATVDVFSSSKRKTNSNLGSDAKRRRNLSYSEKNVKSKRISEFFRSPFDYLSNRRRTIGVAATASNNQNVFSTSGAFEVDVVDDLRRLNDSRDSSGVFSNGKDVRNSLVRKSLFARTFSSAKFKKVPRRRNKKTDFDASSVLISENSICDGARDPMNASCFPDLSTSFMPDAYESRNQQRVCTGSSTRPFTNSVVLTFIFF